MWDEIMDMPGEIFDLDIDDREMMPLDMQEDIEKEDPLLDWYKLFWFSIYIFYWESRPRRPVGTLSTIAP